MSIPVVGRSPIIDRRRGDGGGSLDPRDAVWDGPMAIAQARRRRAAMRAAIFAFLAALGGALGGVEVIPTRYSATSVVSFMPRPSAMTSADTVELLAEKYAVLATSATIMQTAGDAIRARPDELITATTAALDAGTGNLEVTVARPNGQQAVDAANAVADALVRRSRYDELVQAESTSPAVASRVVSRPVRALLRTAAVVGAVLVGVLVWVVARGRTSHRTVRASRRVIGYGAW